MQIWNQLALTIPKLHRPPLAIQICVCYVHLKTSVRIGFSVDFLHSVRVTVDTRHFDRESSPWEDPILPRSITVIAVATCSRHSRFVHRHCFAVSSSASLLMHGRNYRACVREKTSDDERCGKPFEAFALTADTAETNKQIETWNNEERDTMIVDAVGGLDEPRSNAEVDGGSVWTNCAKWVWEKISCDVNYVIIECNISQQWRQFCLSNYQVGWKGTLQRWMKNPRPPKAAAIQPLSVGDVNGWTQSFNHVGKRFCPNVPFHCSTCYPLPYRVRPDIGRRDFREWELDSSAKRSNGWRFYLASLTVDWQARAALATEWQFG